jgi:hypothetical protein
MRGHPSAGVAPLAESARQLSMYDPKTDKWTLIDTYFTTHHLYSATMKPHALVQRRAAL